MLCMMGLIPLVCHFPGGRGGMRAAGGVNADPHLRES